MNNLYIYKSACRVQFKKIREMTDFLNISIEIRLLLAPTSVYIWEAFAEPANDFL